MHRVMNANMVDAVPIEETMEMNPLVPPVLKM